MLTDKWQIADYTGRRFGQRVVLSNQRGTPSVRAWECRCDCGQVSFVQAHRLLEGKSVSCRGCAKIVYRSYGPLGAWSVRTLATLKRTSKHEVAVTLDDLVAQWKIQDGRCYYTGFPLVFADTQEEAPIKQTASLDRRDSNKGYVAGNIQWVHKDVNIMKNKYDSDKFIMIAMIIARRAHAGMI